MKINILGTEYNIEHHKIKEDEKLKTCDGYMDSSIKLIVIGDIEDWKEEKNHISDIVSYQKKVLRHEIIHAFFYESGLWNNSHDVEQWGRDEEMTDWIAIQIPKIVKVMKECDCI